MIVETYEGIDVHKDENYFWFRVVNGRSIISRVFLDVETAKISIDKKIYLWQ
jgi:hypothetical protein